MHEAWNAAVDFLLIEGRAHRLAAAHPLTDSGRCGRCANAECVAAALAAEALAVLAARPQPRHPNTVAVPAPRRRVDRSFIPR